MTPVEAINEGIAQLIRNDIVRGALPFGSRITINELATRYRVSHMPVREALRELQGEGLVTMRPNHGARVRALDGHYIENLFELRNALETLLARRAAQHCTPADIKVLNQIEARLEELVDSGDYAGAIVQNHNFHQTINQIADNPVVTQVIDKHWTLLTALWGNVGYAKDRFPGVMQDHRQLIEALAGNDPDAAAMIMGAHVAKSKLRLMAQIREAESGGR